MGTCDKFLAANMKYHEDEDGNEVGHGDDDVNTYNERGGGGTKNFRCKFCHDND